ncbi:MAG: isoprenyl transferase [Firmicutes bacterium]|nr:isoprenyl transferase [Bacillota bacterium]
MSESVKKLPVHVAMIMDGNGRWAKERGMIRLMGHNAGMEALREIVRHSGNIGIGYLTVYAFSTENWKRPQDEVSGIFRLLVKYVESEIEELNRSNVKVRIIGDLSLLPEESRKAALYAVETTVGNSGLVFSIAINYGGRAEIARAARLIAEDVKSGKLEIGAIDEAAVSARLYTADMPDPDLVIRTGGEHRLSNFLTWQTAYSEVYVTDVYWPDFTPEEYDRALDWYMGRDRRYGGIK